MHVYFSGIGGAGIGPLAFVTKQAGYDVSGSDKQQTSYINYLQSHGVSNIHIGQDRAGIAAVHEANTIDWFVYSSAVSMENADAPELVYCQEQGIRTSKRDELLNEILSSRQQKLIAIAGTHGKTTTTAMTVYLCQKVGLAANYLLAAKTSYADVGHFDPEAEYFIYECDEFDRNFLAFEPSHSIITGVSWDHHEIFPTREDYQSAFREFISQSGKTLLWQEDFDYLKMVADDSATPLSSDSPAIGDLQLKGLYNRLDAWLVIQTVHAITGRPVDELSALMNGFPGLQRRMEPLVPNLYTDYAHTPEKVRGAMSVALEMAADNGQKVVVLYEPLTNRRQIYMRDVYQDVFTGAKHVYWLPSYLAREDPNQPIMLPEELIAHLSDPSIASPADRNNDLLEKIRHHIADGDMVVAMAGGGGNSLDDWLREHFMN